MRKRGIFITFEGPEGSGKSTHSKLLTDFLKRKKYKLLHTREPGGTVISEGIRSILLDPKNKNMDVITEMFLYIAARNQIVKQKIQPFLEKGGIVICDRFHDATLVYQGYAGGIDKKIIKDIGKLVTKNIAPDVTFLLDIDAKAGLLRSGKVKDRMERKSLEFHKRVRKGYLDIARKEPRRVKVLSAVGDKAETQAEIREIVLEQLGQ